MEHQVDGDVTMAMTKEGALRTIIWDANSDRMSRTSYNRVVKAMKVLGLTDEEQLGILNTLEYTDYKTGLVRERYLKRKE